MMHCFMASKQWYKTTQIMREEGNVLFNDTLNTFYLRLYGVTERGNPLVPLHGLQGILATRDILYAPSSFILHTKDFVTPDVEHWLEREID